MTCGIQCTMNRGIEEIHVHVFSQYFFQSFLSFWRKYISDDTLYDVNIPGVKPDPDMTLDWKSETEQVIPQ